MSIDPRAANGFGSAAEAYERGRPSYPVAAIAAVVRDLGLAEAGTALDLAAGTGKLTRVLVPLLRRVVAVEPSRAMLAQLREKLSGVEAVVGTAEAIPLADDSVDAVFVGEAFHWFRAAPACAEIARVLTRGGSLVVVWQRALWAEQQHSWLAAFDALLEPHGDVSRRYPVELDDWEHALERTGRFGSVARAEALYDHDVSAEDFVALVASWSWIANLPGERRAEVLGAVRDLLGDRSALTLRYRTEIYSARLA